MPPAKARLPQPAPLALPRKPSARQLRARLETALERLLEAVQTTVDELDALDPDADLEPSLGAVGAVSEYRSQERWAQGAADEREEQCEDEGGACEDEGANNGDYEPDTDDIGRGEYLLDQRFIPGSVEYCRAIDGGA